MLPRSQIPDPEPGVKKAPNPRSESRNIDYGPEQWHAACQKVRYRTWFPGGIVPGYTVEDGEDEADIVPSHVEPHLFRQLSAHDVGQLLFIVLNRRHSNEWEEAVLQSRKIFMRIRMWRKFDADSDPVCTGIVFSQKNFRM